MEELRKTFESLEKEGMTFDEWIEYETTFTVVELHTKIRDILKLDAKYYDTDLCLKIKTLSETISLLIASLNSYQQRKDYL